LAEIPRDFFRQDAMKILISGASGLIGQQLAAELVRGGHEVARLVRDSKRAAAGDLLWHPKSGHVDTAALEVFDAVVNLAGESIASGRWTARKKAEIRESRLAATETLSSGLAKLSPRPRALINASAVGFYGDRGDERLDETSISGSGDFLSEVCREWEGVTEPASRAGVRVVLARFGVILSANGGALAKMLLPFRLGLGGKIGNGRQWMSWVALDDAVGAIANALANSNLSGPLNVVAPQPVTNAEFTKTLGRVLSRPTIFPMPAFAARAALGQMADALLLASQRVEPAKLLASGYAFQYPSLEGALRHELNR
jgi:uncharacterized protein (TIGR01777 family)